MMRAAGLGVLTAFIAISTFAIPACNGDKVSDRDIEYIGIDDAISMGDGNGGLLGLGNGEVAWIDPRSPQKYRQEHIPGAINFSLEEVREDHPALRGYDTLIVYGDSYNEPIALAMAKRLLANGYDNVYTMRGGLTGWKRAGHDVEAE